jgi:hypothetical protein
MVMSVSSFRWHVEDDLALIGLHEWEQLDDSELARGYVQRDKVKLGSCVTAIAHQ